MEQETASTGSLRAFARDKTFLRRLFDSLVTELIGVHAAYAMGSLDQQGVMERVIEILEGMQALTAGGEVHEVLSRTEAVILSRVFNDMGAHDETGRDISAAAEGDVTP